MTTPEEQFEIGSVVVVSDPDEFVSEFANRVRGRDAIVIENLRSYSRGNTMHYDGRVLVEFQKRGNRGKVFREVIRAAYLKAKGGLE